MRRGAGEVLAVGCGECAGVVMGRALGPGPWALGTASGRYGSNCRSGGPHRREKSDASDPSYASDSWSYDSDGARRGVVATRQLHVGGVRLQSLVRRREEARPKSSPPKAFTARGARPSTRARRLAPRISASPRETHSNRGSLLLRDGSPVARVPSAPPSAERLRAQGPPIYPSNRYPTFHTVTTWRGFAGSASIFRRSSATCESTVRDSTRPP